MNISVDRTDFTISYMDEGGYVEKMLIFNSLADLEQYLCNPKKELILKIVY